MAQMTQTDMLQRVVGIHNCLSQIPVNGDGAIFMGEALKELRALAHDLRKPDKTEDMGKEREEG